LKLQGWLSSGSWSEGLDYCNRDLVKEVSRLPDLRNVSSERLSRLALYCAALASGKGDEASASWWWYTAASIDLKAAQQLLPEMQKLGLLGTLPAPRSRADELKPRRKGEKKVRLPSGEIVTGEPPRPILKPKIRDYLFAPMIGVQGMTVAVEIVVSKEGVPRQPLLMRARALPIHVLSVYHYLSAFRFEPARVNGEAVDCVYSLTVSATP
jgi:hypothetical protein